MKELKEPLRMERMTVREIHPDRIVVKWHEGGHDSTYPVRLLRRACPCAGCRVERDKVRENPLHVVQPLSGEIQVEDLVQVGRYAVNFLFSDGHSSGIYSWDYLRGLCPCEACVKDLS